MWVYTLMPDRRPHWFPDGSLVLDIHRQLESEMVGGVAHVDRYAFRRINNDWRILGALSRARNGDLIVSEGMHFTFATLEDGRRYYNGE